MKFETTYYYYGNYSKANVPECAREKKRKTNQRMEFETNFEDELKECNKNYVYILSMGDYSEYRGENEKCSLSACICIYIRCGFDTEINIMIHIKWNYLSNGIFILILLFLVRKFSM